MRTRTAYSYIRFSTPEQAKGHSLKRQLEAGEACAKRMGWRLDPSLNLRDLGRSGFKAGSQRALQGFLDAIKTRRVKAGSVLIVENLDRLSRQEINEAYEIFRGIIKQGVDIHVLGRDRTYTRDSLNNAFELIDVLISFSVAHEESAKKSLRTNDNWRRARRAAAEDRVPLTGQCPAWLEATRDKRGKPNGFKLKEDAARTLRLIFKLASEGLGARRITAKLNQDKVPSVAAGSKITARNTWNLRYVETILGNRALLGEYQPCRLINSKRVPEGDVIKDYFPRVLDDDTFYRVQAARKARKRQGGRQGKQIANLFTGILRDARTGDTMRIFNSSQTEKASGRGFRRIASYGASLGLAKWISWRYEHLEQAVLKHLRELCIAQLSDEPQDRSIELNEKLTQIDERILKIKARGLEIETLLNYLVELDAERKNVLAEIEDERQKTQAKASSSNKQVATVLDELAAAADPQAKEALRNKLKLVLSHLIKEMWLLIEEYRIHIRGENKIRPLRICTVQLFFEDGWRTLILYRLKQDFRVLTSFRLDRSLKIDLRKWHKSRKPLYISMLGHIFSSEGLQVASVARKFVS